MREKTVQACMTVIRHRGFIPKDIEASLAFSFERGVAWAMYAPHLADQELSPIVRQSLASDCVRGVLRAAGFKGRQRDRLTKELVETENLLPITRIEAAETSWLSGHTTSN